MWGHDRVPEKDWSTDSDYYSPLVSKLDEERAASQGEGRHLSHYMPPSHLPLNTILRPSVLHEVSPTFLTPAMTAY